MKYINDSIYFTIETAIDLKENSHLTIACLKKIIEFLEAVSEVPLMFTYRDNKYFRLKKINEKSKAELYDKLSLKEVYLFMVSEYVKRQDYFAIGAPIKDRDISCTVEMGNSRWNQGNLHFDGISVSVPPDLLEKDNFFSEFLKLYKECHLLIDGAYSYITRGSYYPTFSLENGSTLFRCYYDTGLLFEEYVYGYYWGTCLNEKQINKIENCCGELKNSEHYIIEKWGDKTFIRSSENIFDYSLEEAEKMRELLIHCFPPFEIKKRPFYESREKLYEAREKGKLHLFLDEDLL